jgi:hypothetical protein
LIWEEYRAGLIIARTRIRSYRCKQEYRREEKDGSSILKNARKLKELIATKDYNSFLLFS